MPGNDIVLVTTSSGGPITAWDLETGTGLGAYKGGASAALNTCTLLGKDYFIAAQPGKSVLQIWSWQKEQIHLKCFAPEEITAVCCTSDGVYCAGGGTSGSIYIWETSTGKLLKHWNAHYKKVTCLKFSDGGKELISTSEDTMVAAWLLPEILDASPQTLQGGPAGVTPWRSWTTHTLPVTAVAVGSGGVNAIVVSASLDHTVKIHSLGAGVLLCTFVLPRPLTSLALDPGEHAVYAGSSYGNVYEISLIRPPSADGHNNAEWSEMPQGLSHSKSVSSLALTTDGQLLISGSEDSSVKVWDLGSKQVIRTLGSSGSNGVQQGPVSNVVVLSRPHGMLGLSFAKETNLTRKPKTNKADKIAMQPLAQFSKYVGTAPGADRKGLGDVLVVLRAGREWEPERQPSEINGNNYSGDQPAGAGDDNVGVEEPQTEMTQGGKLLAEENMKLKQQLEQALALARKWSDLNAKLQQKLIDPDTSR